MGDIGSSNHDIVIVGAGVGGYVAAIRAGTWGARVALVEEADIGGTCLNRGCIPTKTLIESAAAFRTAKALCEAAERDLAAMIARKNDVVTGLRKGVSMLLKLRKVEVIEGRATLLDARTVQVAQQEGGPLRLNAQNVILATGSRPAAIPGLEPDGARVYDSDKILDATDVGPRIVVVGGGILGCEFAYIFGALGYDVTIVEMLESIVPVFSADAAREVTRSLKRLGATIRTGTRIEGAEVGDTVKLDLGGEALEADTVLVAAGRKPNVEDIGLDSLGTDILNEKGFVEADAVGRTAAPGLRAVGDVTGKVMLAHAASHQGLASVADCLGKPVAPEGAVPWCAYTHPEVALVGMLEPAAAEAGKQTVTGKFPMMALGRARAAGDTSGYFKVVADAGTKRVLGAEIVGPHATDLIHEAALAVKLEATLEDLEEMVHAHPTFAEGMMEAAGVALGQAIHI
ncbi:MAG: dihydrolipoyl dehydrogenase [Planctomycetota bacterium]